MKAEIKYFIWAAGIGMAIVAYAHNTFSTTDDIARIEKKIDRIVTYLLKDMKRK